MTERSAEIFYIVPFAPYDDECMLVNARVAPRSS